MSKIYKFSKGGYDVEVVKRDDVIECIENNIVDKDIAYEIINQLELDAGQALRQGKRVTIPRLGSIQISPFSFRMMPDEQKQLLENAKEILPRDRYLIFRKQLAVENVGRVKANRYYNYILYLAINRNKKLYKKLVLERGELGANLYMFALANITPLENEIVMFDDNSDSDGE